MVHVSLSLCLSLPLCLAVSARVAPAFYSIDRYVSALVECAQSRAPPSLYKPPPLFRAANGEHATQARGQKTQTSDLVQHLSLCFTLVVVKCVQSAAPHQLCDKLLYIQPHCTLCLYSMYGLSIPPFALRPSASPPAHAPSMGPIGLLPPWDERERERGREKREDGGKGGGMDCVCAEEGGREGMTAARGVGELSVTHIPTHPPHTRTGHTNAPITKRAVD